MAKVVPVRTSARATANVTALSPVFSGRIANSNIPTTIPGYKSRVSNLLCELRRTSDEYRAIELMSEQHPDMSMAVQSFVRLAGGGHRMEIYPLGSDKRDDKAESMWREFAQKSNGVNSKGFDGLVDQMHDSLVRFGGIGAECVVGRRARVLEDVHLVLPQWITWEMDSAGKWHAFQQQNMKRVELTGPNFLWAAMDNDVGKPTGKLMLSPSLVSLDRQLQFFEDVSAVLRRAGYPRNDLSIDREALIKSFDAKIRSDPKKLKNALEEYFDFIQMLMRKLEPTDDYIHFNDITMNKSQGENSRTIDLRAYNEMLDPQVINGLSIMSVLLNRTTGQTETWGTVQMKIVSQNVENIQRGSKRMGEGICQKWLQVSGMQRVCKMVHDPVDWETEETRTKVKLLLQELHRRAQEYGWESAEVAAKDSMGISKLPTTKPPDRTAYVKSASSANTAGTGGNQPGTEESD